MSDLEKCIQEAFNFSLGYSERNYALLLVAEGKTDPVASDEMREGAWRELAVRRPESFRKALRTPAAR